MASAVRTATVGTNVTVAFAHGAWSNPSYGTGPITTAGGGGFTAFYIGDVPVLGKFSTILQLASYGFTYPNPIVVKGLFVRVRRYQGAGNLKVSLRSDAPGQPAINVFKTVTPGGTTGSPAIATLGSSVDLWGAAWNQLQTEWIYVQVQGTGTSSSEEDWATFSAGVEAVEITVYYSSVLSGAVLLSGGGGLSAMGAEVHSGAAVLDGVGAAAVAGVRGTFGAAAASGSGELSVDGTVIPLARSVDVTWAQFEVPEGVPAPVVTGAAALSGSGALSASGLTTPTVTGAATLSGSGALSAVGVIPVDGVAALSGVGVLTALGVPEKFSAVALSGASTLIAFGQAFVVPPSIRPIVMESVDLAVEMETVDVEVTLEPVEEVVELL